MSIGDLDRALELIRSNRDIADFAGPREDRLVEAAQAALGLIFPPTYRKFLTELGCGDIGGAEFYGVVDDDFVDSSVPDGIWLTLKHRRENHVPRALVLVSDTGDGGYYAIDTACPDEHGEVPVIVWFPGLSTPSEQVERVADDFGAFFLRRVTQAVK